MFVLVGQAVAAPGAKLVVDDDGEQCRNAEFTSIQAAVDAAPPGDRIKVCPGLYEESVQVDKTLSLKGKGGNPEKRPQSGVGDPNKEAIVDPPGTDAPGFNILANEVKITGFTVTGAVNQAGIATNSQNSGHRIEGNLIRDNTFGLYLNSSGEFESVVTKNVFRNNNEPGSAAGNGIYSDQGLVDATISKNYFTGHENTSVILIGLTPDRVSNVGVNKNEIIDDGTIILAGASESEVSDNTSENSNSNGIQFGFGGGTAAFGVTNTEVTGNKLSDGEFSGINVFSSTENAFVNNDVRGFADGGIRLRENSDDKDVDGNKAFENGNPGQRNGISMESESSGNTITNNKARDNQKFDCNDETRGNGTSDTANTWTDNKGKTSNPPGLCEPKGDEGNEAQE